MENKNKNLWLILGLLVIVAIIIAIVMSQKKNLTMDPSQNPPVAVTDENNNSAPTVPITPTPVVSDNPVLKDAVVVVPGTSPVTKDNKVVNDKGQQTVNNVPPSSPVAPTQTQPVDKNRLGNNVIKIDVSAAGFSPNQFTVNAGAPATIALTATDKYSHVFMFDDPSLMAVAIGVMSGETRAMTFNAPTKAGEYTFRCDVPGHAQRGEIGKMIVK